MKVIKKLNNLKYGESFIQVNIQHGYKYIDKAGEIVNTYHTPDGKPPIFRMGLDGLILTNPVENIVDLKVTPELIWAKFGHVNTYDSLAQSFVKEFEKIIKILEVTQVDRIGWRNYFIYEFSDKDKLLNYSKKLFKMNDLNLLNASFELDAKTDIKAQLNIQPVVKNDVDKSYGVLFDVDFYKKGVFKTSDLREILEEIREFMSKKKDNVFLKILDESFV